MPRTPRLVGIAADHGGYELKEHLVRMLRDAGHDVIDFGDQQPKLDDDYPISVVRWLAQLPTQGGAWRGHLRQRRRGISRREQSRRSSGLLDSRELFGASKASRTTT